MLLTLAVDAALYCAVIGAIEVYESPRHPSMLLYPWLVGAYLFPGVAQLAWVIPTALASRRRAPALGWGLATGASLIAAVNVLDFVTRHELATQFYRWCAGAH